jgi:hypothetical protein
MLLLNWTYTITGPIVTSKLHYWLLTLTKAIRQEKKIEKCNRQGRAKLPFLAFYYFFKITNQAKLVRSFSKLLLIFNSCTVIVQKMCLFFKVTFLSMQHLSARDHVHLRVEVSLMN